jgi:hypothetical protein
MESPESYRTTALPDLGQGATVARILVVAGPVALLSAQLVTNSDVSSGAGTVLSRVAVPLMLAWAAVLFLVTRSAAPVAAWTGLVAVTLELTLVQEFADGWLLLMSEAVGFVAFAVALSRLWWVPRGVLAMFVAFPLVDAFTTEHSNLLQLVGFSAFAGAGVVIAARMRLAGSDPQEVVVEAPMGCSRYRTCMPGRTCCVPSSSSIPARIHRPLA